MDLDPALLAQLGTMPEMPDLGSINLSFQDTVNKEYQRLQSYRNVTSYSMLNELHACARKYQLIKSRAAAGGSGGNNVDFAFGHSVGSGIQSWIATRDLDSAILNGMLAWKLPFGVANPKAKKSIWEATLAVEKYVTFHNEALDDWDVWVLPSGKPAIELSIEIDFENGYKHYIHIDVILKNRRNGQLAVQENKTTSFKNVDAALYANSNQSLGYAVAVDLLSENTSFEVFYCIYSTSSREWQLMPFTKHTSLKAEWLADVRLDHSILSAYHQVQFYPKRGESCFAYSRRCEFFGTCNMISELTAPKELDAADSAERVDYSFKLSELIARQHERNVKGNEEIHQPAGFSSID